MLLPPPSACCCGGDWPSLRVATGEGGGDSDTSRPAPRAWPSRAVPRGTTAMGPLVGASASSSSRDATCSGNRRATEPTDCGCSKRGSGWAAARADVGGKRLSKSGAAAGAGPLALAARPDCCWSCCCCARACIGPSDSDPLPPPAPRAVDDWGRRMPCEGLRPLSAAEDCAIGSACTTAGGDCSEGAPRLNCTAACRGANSTFWLATTAAAPPPLPAGTRKLDDTPRPGAA
jgi:hypothetical protein